MTTPTDSHKDWTEKGGHVTRSMALMLWVLVALTALATLQRALLLWRPAEVITALPAHPADVQLSVLNLRPPRVSPGHYQKAVLVRRHAPSWSLVQRRLVDTDSGPVAIGVLASGVPSLQTCLMGTGRAAVTFEQMREQVLQTGPRGFTQTLQAGLGAMLLGRPLRQRNCLLVLMRSQATSAGTAKTAQQQRQLLQAWNSIRPSLVARQPH